MCSVREFKYRFFVAVPPPLTAHLNPHLLEVKITIFMAPCPSSSDVEKHSCLANAVQFKLMCGQKAGVAMILAKATFPAAVLTPSAGRKDRCPTKEKLRHRQPVCNFLEIGGTRRDHFHASVQFPSFPLHWPFTCTFHFHSVILSSSM